jgi:hypothetical protein
MTKLLDEVRFDLSFIRSHTLQPKWWKVMKVFVLAGVMAGYFGLFGLVKTIAFFASFMLLSLFVHMVYRVKTEKYSKSWLDFVVVEEAGEARAKRIGRYYYAAILLNAALSIAISQLLF